MIFLFFVDAAELCKTSRKYFSKKYFAQYHPIGEYKRFFISRWKNSSLFFIKTSQ
jgi:hypothetical protein